MSAIVLAGPLNLLCLCLYKATATYRCTWVVFPIIDYQLSTIGYQLLLESKLSDG